MSQKNNTTKLSLTGKVSSAKVYPFAKDCCWSRNCPANSSSRLTDYDCSFAKVFDKIQIAKPTKQAVRESVGLALF